MGSSNVRRIGSSSLPAIKMTDEKPSDTMKLHPSEMKLIQVIRAIEFGEIEGLAIENGLPAYYKGAKKTCKLA